MIDQTILFALTGVALFAIALHNLFARTHLLRKILALNIAGSGVFLVFIALARRGAGAVDPVPHAMVLTGIVVAVSATALALAITRRYFDDTRTTRLPEDTGPAGARQRDAGK